MIYRVGSLFAGVGGICLGFKMATYNHFKYELIWANEVDDYACATYTNNFNHLMIQGDFEKIVNPDCENDIESRKVYLRKHNQIMSHAVDILTAGFPCQSFSIAGSRKGFDDHRGSLFWSIIDLIKLIALKQEKPKILFLENVKNLQTHDQGKTYGLIKTELEKVGYIVKEKVLNTKDFTRLPQNRERIYIVAFLDSNVADNFTMFDDNILETLKTKRDESQRINHIRESLDLHLNKKVAEKYYYTKFKYPHYFLSEEEYAAQDKAIRKAIRINMEEDITEKYQFYQLRRGMNIRKNMTGMCPTLTASMGLGGHNVPLIKTNDGIRKLTPNETFRLQGFPIGNGYELPRTFNGRPFPEGRLYKQAGNAVSVVVIKLIAEEILKALYATNNY